MFAIGNCRPDVETSGYKMEGRCPGFGQNIKPKSPNGLTPCSREVYLTVDDKAQ
jgi:hypothetical protein